MVSSWLPIYMGLPKYNKSTWNVTAVILSENIGYVSQPLSPDHMCLKIKCL